MDLVDAGLLGGKDDRVIRVLALRPRRVGSSSMLETSHRRRSAPGIERIAGATHAARGQTARAADLRESAAMGLHLTAFLGIAAIVIVTPGPDTALVTKNALCYGRRPAIATAFGVTSGLLVWTLAAALGVAAVVHASATAFTVMKLAGAAYLIWLGIQALRAAGHRSRTTTGGERTAPPRRRARLPPGSDQRPREPEDRRVLHEPAAAVHRARPVGARAVPRARRALRGDHARVAGRLRRDGLEGRGPAHAPAREGRARPPHRRRADRARAPARDRTALR